MRFDYLPQEVDPLPGEEGTQILTRPVVVVRAVGPAGAWLIPGLVDTGATETLLPLSYVARLGASVDENSVTLLTDAGALSTGKGLFEANCVACHGAAAEGKSGLGPNLTDPYWIHGGGIKNVFTTIKYGVTAKGMIAWKTQMKANELHAVASYVLSLQGTSPANAQAPQGDLWKEDGEAAADSTSIVPADSTVVPTDSLKSQPKLAQVQ